MDEPLLPWMTVVNSSYEIMGSEEQSSNTATNLTERANAKFIYPEAWTEYAEEAARKARIAEPKAAIYHRQAKNYILYTVKLRRLASLYHRDHGDKNQNRWMLRLARQLRSLAKANREFSKRLERMAFVYKGLERRYWGRKDNCMAKWQNLLDRAAVRRAEGEQILATYESHWSLFFGNSSFGS